jgi:hypothetical protein
MHRLISPLGPIYDIVHFAGSLPGTDFLYALANKIAADSISNLYATTRMSCVIGAQLEIDKESCHDREGIPLQRVGDR